MTPEGTAPSELPRTIEELLEGIQGARANDLPDGPLTYHVAEALGALHHCDIGGEPILDVERLAVRLVKHYAQSEARLHEVEEAIRHSGLEIGDPLSPNYCSYHAQVTSE